MNRPKLTLLTDLYELTMMQGYYVHGQTETVIFDVFFRSNPCNNGYSVCAGLDQIIDYIKNLHFTYEDVDYLRSLGLFSDDFLHYLSGFHFSGDIYAIPEGTVVFPREPLLKVIAPIMEAQLVETAILNILNHQSLIATKTSRIVFAANGDGIMEFGLRRAQGPDAGLYGARAAMIGGCVGTSNVLAGQLFDVPVMGTHAHSWIMSFPDEYTAFKTYADMYPDNCTLLVDTYDTLKSGVPNAIRVFHKMKEEGKPLKRYGIRLDSGDLAYLSKKARQMLDEAGFSDATICASNDLDEYLLHDLKMQGAAIDSWGVGTNLITSKDCPSFGGVYKLAAIQDAEGVFLPKIKISENSEKITNPGNKTIFRIYDKASQKVKADLIAFADEVFDPSEDLLLFDPVETWKKTLLPGGTYTIRELLVPVFRHGECVYTSPTVKEIADYCKQEKDTLWDETKRLFYPHRVYVDLSPRLYEVRKTLLDQIHSSR
ncbi:nicotinate phosphoribosyltransferase [Suipraeoptans intestinalis]|uniref:Nicotinate phosphoribosyltransferase n=1 Tax=Suipraeoptans intestinalis TaxID=2606628 RepID=A0A6N7V1Y3_9FIRM|nr:nicotinate phosphoribosyltransferase [Suipraeoptans intestinalis]MDD7769969.1 nicotinate phosphoribosyltransferase [Suipraeoptans intestinalis]MDY3121959.1 nicotinate phosphoribosyltransferase [Suipraeoptans intestinalis]MSR94177.1 nicotinate phosphoribosyltransferase [Suipraeoptans intestinalis]